MSGKGNILLVANWDSDVGYAWWLMESFWVAISSHFREQGMECYLVYPVITKIPEAIADSDIHTLELDFRNHSLPSLKKLYRLIREKSIKYAYLTDSPSYSLFYPLLRLWGLKSIVIHDHTPGERTPPSRAKFLLKRIIQHTPFITADHYVAATDFVYHRLINIAGIPEKKCSCASNGIEPINLDDHNIRYTHEQFGIPDNKRIIVTTGRATYYKGIDFFIECANFLVNKSGRKDLHFLYCGTGPDIDDFKTLAHKYKLEENFTFAGNRNDIKEILPSCDIGFHAATGEVGYSLSILEYMSAGLLTIVPDTPSTSSAITDREDGFLYKYRDIASATDTILHAVNLEDASRVSSNAIRKVQQKYNLSNTKKQLVRILSNCYLITHGEANPQGWTD